ncbi:hypothetical protein [Lacipirellula sp.]|uniref:hypothetical protein n=1 Tax=Lacipirellula sp. TaxID=2691419 RepID=UPI003D142AD2
MGTRRVRKSGEFGRPCDKAPMPSRKVAERSRSRLLQRDRRRGDGFRTTVFYCDICGAWHIGTVRKDPKR